ncbi:MAG: hypothetical protein ACD_49C00005G0001, partial [uncultured bacterium (gcode 4)]
MKKDLNILFIAHSSEIGGAEKSLIELLRGLVKNGTVCHVIVPAEGSLAEELKKFLVKTYVTYLPWCADGEKKYNHDRIIEIGKSSLEVIKLIKEIQPDIVYSNSSVILQGAIASKILGIRHVWHIREFGELDYNIDYYLPIKQRAKFVFEYSDKIIFISNSLRDYYHNYISDEKSEVVYNNVKILDDVENHEIRKDKNLNLLMVGNVHPAKGQFDAVRAIKLLKDQGISDIKLKVIGRKLPEYYKEIMNFIEEYNLFDQIEFCDFVSNPAKFFKEADIVLMCSKSEGFGRVTVEAMLFEKPVIGSFSGGTKEIVVDNKNGLFYEPGNISDLSKKIEFFYRNRNKIAEFGKNGKIFCEDIFSEERYVGRIRNILENLKNSNDHEFKNLFLSVFDEVECLNYKINDELTFNKKRLKVMQKKLKLKQESLDKIYNSREWRMVLNLQKIFKIIFPASSLGRKILVKFFRLARRVVKVIFKIKRKISELFLLSRKYLMRFKSRKKRTINLKSRKIVYVDHSYHNKTLSNDFFLAHLEENFEVKVIWSDSWKGESFPDLSFVDDSYLGVIFFQTLPTSEELKKINNDNLVFIPMYDSVSHDYNFWSELYNLKIINFSKTLNNKLKKWRMETLGVQY